MPRVALVAAALATLTATAAADRAANFTARVVGSDPAHVFVNHDAKGWDVHLDTRTLRVPQVPASHGDYLVFAAPARDRVAFVRAGDAELRTVKPGDTAVWIYAATGTLVATIAFSALFTPAELAALPYSTSGMDWQAAAAVAKDSRLTVPAWTGAPVVVDLAARTATRKH